MLESLNLQVSELHMTSPSAWRPRQPQMIIVPGRNHFSVIEALGEPEHPLLQRALRCFLSCRRQASPFLSHGEQAGFQSVEQVIERADILRNALLAGLVRI